MGSHLPRPIRPSRCRRRRQVALLLAFALLLTSCQWTSRDQYFVHWGPRTDVLVRERTSWDLTFARALFYANNNDFSRQMGGFKCRANRSAKMADVCVMRLLHTRTQIHGAVKGMWRRATADSPVKVDDFRGAFNRIRSSVRPRLFVADCLTLSVYPHTTNWTTRSRSDRNCKVGRHVWE